MKQRPILLSTLMIQSTAAGLKTHTRRTKGLEEVNFSPNTWQLIGITHETDSSDFIQWFVAADGTRKIIICPYGKPGDILWLRETFCTPIVHDGMENDYYYKADDISAVDVRRSYMSGKWKPSIFMPKAACRYHLVIKNIVCERLRNISPEDAIREGIEPIHQYAADIMKNGKLYKDYMGLARGLYAVNSFLSLWESIEGKESVDLNPWVWVIKFEVKKV